MPHVCGDEPQAEDVDASFWHVCPTYVGMNRGEAYDRHRIPSMPHVCGDEPDPSVSDNALT